jgi:hypothetical protein
MTRRKRFIIVVILFASLIIGAFTTASYSQQNSESSKKPVAAQKQPVERQPFQNRFQWQAGLEVIADLRGDQLTYTGSCPTTFTFKGSISTNRAMTVHYRFLRSDDVRTIPVALKLGKDERKELTYSWEVGGSSGSSEFNGWVFLQAIYPTNMKTVSNVVNFKVNCTNREEKSTQENTKQQLSFGSQQGQKVPGVPSTGTPAQLPQGKGPVPAGPPTIQQGQPLTGGLPLTPPPQGGQGPGSMPMPTGQSPGGMPILQLGQKGPMPGESPMLPGTGKGPIPGNTSMPLLNQQGQTIALKEDCISFNPDTTTMEQISFGWRIMDGSQIIFGFDFDKTEAMIALATIKHYKMTQSCFVGRPRPTFHYMLAGGSSPVGSFRPSDCAPFNPATTNVRQINGSWKVADGSNELFGFGEKQDEADQTLAIIKKYGFTYSCMIAKGKVEYVYMRK